MDTITEACWEGYKQVGMKDKGGKMVPNCVPIKEEVLEENAGWMVWAQTIQRMIQDGTLSPGQGALLFIGAPAAIYHAIDTGFGQSYVDKFKEFVTNFKEKKKINPEQVDKLISDTEEAVKDLPAGKQKYAVKLMQHNKDALASGDKNKMLQAQRQLKTYVNREIDAQNQEMDKLHRATSKKTAAATEKHLAPPGAIHAGWGRWTDASGKTLGFTRDGKWVPAKQKLQENEHEIYDGQFCPACLAKYILEAKKGGFLNEAEYQGRKVSLGKPFRTSGGPKKFSVYVKNKKGNVVKVNFGDPNMRIKKNIPGRRKSFRARYRCATAKDRTSARYWSCRKW